MSGSDEGGNQAALAILGAELARLCDATRESWRGFLTWFTWSLGTQTVVLGWIITRKDGERPAPELLIVLSIGLVAFNMLGLLAARKIGSFAALQGQRAETVCRAMSDQAEASGLNVHITAGFSGEFIRSAATQCAGALFTAVVMWMYLFCSTTFDSHPKSAKPASSNQIGIHAPQVS